VLAALQGYARLGARRQWANCEGVLSSALKPHGAQVEACLSVPSPLFPRGLSSPILFASCSALLSFVLSLLPCAHLAATNARYLHVPPGAHRGRTAKWQNRFPSTVYSCKHQPGDHKTARVPLRGASSLRTPNSTSEPQTDNPSL